MKTLVWKYRNDTNLYLEVFGIVVDDEGKPVCRIQKLYDYDRDFSEFRNFLMLKERIEKEYSPKYESIVHMMDVEIPLID